MFPSHPKRIVRSYSISTSDFIQKEFTVGIQNNSDKKYSKKFDQKNLRIQFTESIQEDFSAGIENKSLMVFKRNHSRYSKNLTEDFQKEFGRYSKRIDIAI